MNKKIGEETSVINERTENVEKQNSELKDAILELQKALQSIQTEHSRFYSGYIVWRIDEVSKHLNKASSAKLTSAPFYTKCDGYKMCLIVYLNGDGAGKGSHLSVYFAIMRGEHDPVLKWPFMAKVTITLLSQDHNKHSTNKDIIRSFIPDPNSLSVRMPESSIINQPTGFQRFIRHSTLNSQRTMYVKDDVIFIKAVVDTSI